MVVLLALQVTPGVPDRLMELVLVEVAHFAPVQVQVLVEGTYPLISLNLPRVRDEAFMQALQQATVR
jgi:hydrocephalus-inducing protein